MTAGRSLSKHVKPIWLTLPLVFSLISSTVQGVSAADITTRSVTAEDGIRLSVQESGSPTGPEIVFIHGLLGSDVTWERQVAAPELQRFRIITYDLRGHGFSDKPSNPSAYSDGRLWAGDLRTVLTELHVKKPVIVGWSLGGLVLANYLKIYGDGAIAGIVYVDGVTEMAPEYFKLRPEVSRLLVSDKLAEYVDGIAQFVGLCFSTQPDPHTMSRLMSAAGLASPVMIETVGFGISDPTGTPASTSLPTMLIYGELDATVRKRMIDRQKELIPQARISLYPTSGHSPFFEDATRFNRELSTFATAVIK